MNGEVTHNLASVTGIAGISNYYKRPRILDLAEKHPVTIAEISETLQIKQRTVVSYVRVLVAEGALVLSGKRGRANLYSAKPPADDVVRVGARIAEPEFDWFWVRHRRVTSSEHQSRVQ